MTTLNLWRGAFIKSVLEFCATILFYVEHIFVQLSIYSHYIIVTHMHVSGATTVHVHVCLDPAALVDCFGVCYYICDVGFYLFADSNACVNLHYTASLQVYPASYLYIYAMHSCLCM